MSYGLRIWDAAGNLLVDPSYSLCRFLGMAVIGPSDSSLSHAGFSDGEPWYFVSNGS